MASPIHPDSSSSRAAEKQLITSADAPSPSGAYSPGVRIGDLIFASGQAPIDPRTGDSVGESIEDQTRQVLRNLEAVLAAAGASLADVVKITAHLESFDLFEGFDATYRGFFSEPLPARTTVASGLGGILVELDAIGVAPSAGADGQGAG